LVTKLQESKLLPNSTSFSFAASAISNLLLNVESLLLSYFHLIAPPDMLSLYH